MPRNEKVGRGELGEHPSTVASPGQRIRQLRAERVGHGGTEQELPQAIGLPVEDLVQQVVGDRPVVAREAAEKSAAVRLGREREPREADPGRPAFGASADSLDVSLRQVVRERPQGLAALVHGEGELGGSDLAQVVREPQTLQPQLWVGPGRDHEAKSARGAVDESLQLPPNDRALDHVEVVEHEHDRLCATIELVRRRAGPWPPRPRASAEPSRAPARASACSTPSQNRGLQLSSRSSPSQATLRTSEAEAHEERSTVLPVPACDETSVTSPAAPRSSSSWSLGRWTSRAGAAGGTSFVAGNDAIERLRLDG